MRCKRGELEHLVQILTWVLFFILAIFGVYFLIKFLTNS